MLESMRNAAQGFVGRIIMTVVMGLIIVSFVIWGVGDMLRGFTSTTVASVGSTKITQQEFRDSYQRTLQQYQRRLRQPFTNEQARAVGLDREVLQRLLSQAALDNTTHKLGLGISDSAIRSMITSNPAFRNKDGQFDPQMFASVLRDNDLNERMFVDDLRKTALRQFIVAALTAGVVAPKAEVAAEANYDGQIRSAAYFVLPASAAGDIQPPTEAALKSFLQRPQGRLSRAGIPFGASGLAFARRPRQSCRSVGRRRSDGLRQARGQGPALRRTGEAHASADPVSERSGRRGGRGEAQSRRDL